MADLLNRFLDTNGLVKQWPSKRAAQLEVLTYVAHTFPIGCVYTEAEINEALKKIHTFRDWAILRRELCDLGYFDRDVSGIQYKRTKKL